MLLKLFIFLISPVAWYPMQSSASVTSLQLEFTIPFGCFFLMIIIIEGPGTTSDSLFCFSLRHACKYHRKKWFVYSKWINTYMPVHNMLVKKGCLVVHDVRSQTAQKSSHYPRTCFTFTCPCAMQTISSYLHNLSSLSLPSLNSPLSYQTINGQTQ